MSTLPSAGSAPSSRSTTPSGPTTSERPTTPGPACPTARTAHVFSIARAIENTCAVLAVGQAGPGVVGRSLVVGPDGVVDLELGAEPALGSVDIDPARIARERERNPSLVNRRYTTTPLP